MAGLNDYVSAFVLSFEHGIQKPDRRMFEIALEQLEVKPSDALMFGDGRMATVAQRHAGFDRDPPAVAVRRRAADSVDSWVSGTMEVQIDSNQYQIGPGRDRLTWGGLPFGSNVSQYAGTVGQPGTSGVAFEVGERGRLKNRRLVGGVARNQWAARTSGTSHECFSNVERVTEGKGPSESATIAWAEVTIDYSDTGAGGGILERPPWGSRQQAADRRLVSIGADCRWPGS